MVIDDPSQLKHFSVELLNKGVFACIHKEGGIAYSNVGSSKNWLERWYSSAAPWNKFEIVTFSPWFSGVLL
jgi:hypothetical protein